MISHSLGCPQNQHIAEAHLQFESPKLRDYRHAPSCQVYEVLWFNTRLFACWTSTLWSEPILSLTLFVLKKKQKILALLLSLGSLYGHSGPRIHRDPLDPAVLLVLSQMLLLQVCTTKISYETILKWTWQAQWHMLVIVVFGKDEVERQPWIAKAA